MQTLLLSLRKSLPQVRTPSEQFKNKPVLRDARAPELKQGFFLKPIVVTTLTRVCADFHNRLRQLKIHLEKGIFNGKKLMPICWFDL